MRFVHYVFGPWMFTPAYTACGMDAQPVCVTGAIAGVTCPGCLLALYARESREVKR